MIVFKEKFVPLFAEYKRILKRYLEPEERDQKIVFLGIKRRHLREDSDLLLYRKAQEIIKDIESWVGRSSTSATAYSGIDEFCQHLKVSLSEYHIDENKVIHTKMQSSRAMVQAIQILSQTDGNVTPSSVNKLDSCVMIIARYGSSAQRKMLNKALQALKEKNSQHFSPLANSFEAYITADAAVINE